MDSDNDYEVEMTWACEKLFIKLTRREQQAVDSRISDICQDPSQGEYLEGRYLDGLLHTHASGKSSNLLVIWSYDDNPKRIVIEGVGPHKVIDWLARQKKILSKNR